MSIVETLEGDIKTVFGNYPQVAHDDAQAALTNVSAALLAGSAKAKEDAEAAIRAHCVTLGAALDAHKALTPSE